MNILAVGAHYDDIELGCGGTLLKLRDEGHNIYLYVGTTSGFQAIKDYGTVRKSQEAMKEGAEVAKMLGAKHLYTGEARTFHLDYTADINTELAKIVELNEIDLMFTHWSDDSHHDHWSLAKASYHAGKHVKRILEYNSSYYEGKSQFTPNFYFDISDYIAKKIELLKMYDSEYNRVGDKWKEMVYSSARLYGLKNDCKYAEGYHCIRWLW